MFQKNGTIDEETLTLRPSATAQEIIEDCLRSFDYLDNDPLAYRLIMKAYEFGKFGIEFLVLFLTETTDTRNILQCAMHARVWLQ